MCNPTRNVTTPVLNWGFRGNRLWTHSTATQQTGLQGCSDFTDVTQHALLQPTGLSPPQPVISFLLITSCGIRDSLAKWLLQVDNPLRDAWNGNRWLPVCDALFSTFISHPRLILTAIDLKITPPAAAALFCWSTKESSYCSIVHRLDWDARRNRLISPPVYFHC